MPKRTQSDTGALKSRIDQIAGNERAAPEEPGIAGAAAGAAGPATDAAAPTPAPAQPEEPGASGATQPPAAAAPRTRKRRGEGIQITVRVESEMHARLKQMAIDDDRSVQAVVRRTLREAIAAHEAQKAASAAD